MLVVTVDEGLVSEPATIICITRLMILISSLLLRNYRAWSIVGLDSLIVWTAENNGGKSDRVVFEFSTAKTLIK